MATDITCICNMANHLYQRWSAGNNISVWHSDMSDENTIMSEDIRKKIENKFAHQNM